MASLSAQDHGRRRRRHRRARRRRRSASSPTSPVMHQVVTAQLRRPPGRHAEHQDPRRGARRRRQAVEAEGHRSRPSGSTRSPQLDRWWRGPRARSPAATPRSTPKKMITPGAALGPVGPCRRRQGRRGRRLGLRRAEHQGRHRRPGRPRHRGPRSSSCSSATTSPPGRASATSRTSTSSKPGELNAYDVLVQRLRGVHPEHRAGRPVAEAEEAP